MSCVKRVHEPAEPGDGARDEQHDNAVALKE